MIQTVPYFILGSKLRTPLMQQWHMGVQYQVTANTVLDVSYAGSHGQRLYAFYNGNQIPGGIQGDPPFPALNNQITPISTFRSNSFSNYNSLQASLERRFSKGLQFGLPTPTATHSMTRQALALAL